MPKKQTGKKYKDSGNVAFAFTYYIPRRKLKLLFDKEKAELLNDLVPPDKKRREEVRKLTFEQFLEELTSNFQLAVEDGSIKDPLVHSCILDWAEWEFQSWVL